MFQKRIGRLDIWIIFHSGCVLIHDILYRIEVRNGTKQIIGVI